MRAHDQGQSPSATRRPEGALAGVLATSWPGNSTTVRIERRGCGVKGARRNATLISGEGEIQMIGGGRFLDP